MPNDAASAPASGRHSQPRSNQRAKQCVGIGAYSIERDIAEIQRARRGRPRCSGPSRASHRSAPWSRRRRRSDWRTAGTATRRRTPGRRPRGKRHKARAAPDPGERGRDRRDTAGRTVRRPTRSRRPAATRAIPISTQSKRKLRPVPPSILTVCMPTRGRNRTSATNAASAASLSAVGQSIRLGAAAVSLRTRPATAQTFSISGLPSRPVGRKIRTRTRSANAATSLYSLLK